MEYQVAQVNIGRMLGPIDGPVMADFVANLDPINLLAENSEGFVWRLKGDGNDATSLRIYDDDMMIINMSVWQSIEALFAFAYRSAHTEIFKRRREWFEKMAEHYMTLWYVPAGHVPTVEEAIERLDYLRAHGIRRIPSALKAIFKWRGGGIYKAVNGPPAGVNYLFKEWVGVEMRVLP